MLFVIGTSVNALNENITVINVFFTLLFAIILPIFVLWMWLTTFYVIEANNLVIKCGPYKKKVSFDSIKSVKKTTSSLSSPALSLKRLEIEYGVYDSVLISPYDRDEFIEILSKHCPHIKVKT
ncbi:PH domain-containing protein [Virgibacillus oceani]